MITRWNIWYGNCKSVSELRQNVGCDGTARLSSFSHKMHMNFTGPRLPQASQPLTVPE